MKAISSVGGAGDPGQRDEHLGDAGGVIRALERDHAEQPGRILAVEAVDGVLERPQLLEAPRQRVRRQRAAVQPVEEAGHHLDLAADDPRRRHQHGQHRADRDQEDDLEAVRHPEAREQRERAADDHHGDGHRVDQVLDRQARHGRGERDTMPDVDGLGRLAGEQAERRQVAEGVAGEEGGEGVADPQPGVGRGAERPGPGPDEQAEARQQDDDQEAPADALHAGDDLVQPGLPQSQREQCRAEQRRRDAPRRDPPALAFARLGPAAVVHAHARDRVPRRSAASTCVF